jgi:hypothetical protein
MKVLKINSINKNVCLHNLDMSVLCVCVILTSVGISLGGVGTGRVGDDNILVNIGSQGERLPSILHVRGELYERCRSQKWDPYQ